MEKMLVFLSFLVLAVAFGLWLVKPRTAAIRNAEQIRAALQRLLKRPYGAYIIIEDTAFGKYVQISGSKNEPLVFDLPRQLLSLDEFERACWLFKNFTNTGPETFDVFDSSGGRPAGTQTSFIVNFGQDIEHVAQLAVMVFSSVYCLNKHEQLKILEQ